MKLLVLSDGETYSLWEDKAAVLEIPDDSTVEQIDAVLVAYKAGALFQKLSEASFYSTL